MAPAFHETPRAVACDHAPPAPCRPDMHREVVPFDGCLVSEDVFIGGTDISLSRGYYIVVLHREDGTQVAEFKVFVD